MATEKRLIDANALIAKFPVIGQFEKDLWHSATIRAAIDNAPTVDAVEVVRCKDCKHGEVYGSYYICKNIHVGTYGWGMRKNDFCSYGERRTEK